MRKTPFRPDDRRITQSYRDGVVRIYTVTDGAAPGYQPRPVLTLLETLFYQERRVGLQRYYAGRQAQVEVERVMRATRPSRPSNTAATRMAMAAARKWPLKAETIE